MTDVLSEEADPSRTDNCSTGEEIHTPTPVEERLRQALDIKNRCVGILVHDLRTPLTIIKGYASLLKRSCGGEGACATCGKLGCCQRNLMIDRILVACNNLQDLLDDTLDFNAIEAGALELLPKPVEVANYLREFHQTHNILGMGKGIQLDVEVNGDSGVGWFDPKRINQVLENLVTNAIKYSDPETRILLRGLPAAGSTIAMEVADEGVGIAEEEYPRLFTEFGRTSNRPTAGEQSVGLGLAICRKIILAHGGEIDVRPNYPAGSIFRFSLPKV